jgi:hypothetical protein
MKLTLDRALQKGIDAYKPRQSHGLDGFYAAIIYSTNSLDRLTQLTGATDEKKAANLMLIIAWFHKQGWVSLDRIGL